MKWANMRIEASVMDRLEAFRTIQENRAADGKAEFPSYASADRLSYSDTVSELLRRAEEHRARSRKSKHNRASKRAKKELDSECRNGV
jgi:hypothetical protein